MKRDSEDQMLGMEETLTLAETARRLRVNPLTVRRLIHRGRLSVYRDPIYEKGGPVKIPVVDIEKLERLRSLPLTPLARGE